MQSNPEKITPEIVEKFQEPTDDFLCPLSANHYNIQFLEFKIRDCDTNQVFFEIKREQEEEEAKEEIPQYEEPEYRTVRYHFGPDFFKLKAIGTTLVFSVGQKEVKKFKMIERHYFKNKLIKSYDFTFPFCIPDTVNTWESMYSVPEITEEMKQEMINSPWQTKSDSFYFVNGELIMHNKAEYNYAKFDAYEDY